MSHPGIVLTVAMTGASGAALTQEILRRLEDDARVARVHFVASDNSLRVAAEELGITGRNALVARLLGRESKKIVQHSMADVGAPIASGSYRVDGMVILPCSMGTLASIASGLAESLVARAADVCLKEGRPLLLCVRETPFNRIHLRNMSAAADAGAIIFPVMPSFYDHPKDGEAMIRQYVCRVLARVNLPQEDMQIWAAET